VLRLRQQTVPLLLPSALGMPALLTLQASIPLLHHPQALCRQ
jgi:hypothetical protein